MAINSEVRLRAQGEFSDIGRQEFIVSVGTLGCESTYYVGIEQMRAWKRQIELAMISADRHERETLAAQEKEAA